MGEREWSEICEVPRMMTRWARCPLICLELEVSANLDTSLVYTRNWTSAGSISWHDVAGRGWIHEALYTLHFSNNQPLTYAEKWPSHHQNAGAQYYRGWATNLPFPMYIALVHAVVLTFFSSQPSPTISLTFSCWLSNEVRSTIALPRITTGS